jgi:hypothetical protein
MKTNPYDEMREQCALLGHDDEYEMPNIGLCYYCKAINPKYEEL